MKIAYILSGKGFEREGEQMIKYFCNRCEIEREALLKHAHIGMTRVSDTEWQKGYWDGVDDMAEYIREEPAADVAEVTHSEWYCSSVSMKTRNITCWNCRRTETISNGRENFNYCPNCGARMDGEGEWQIMR